MENIEQINSNKKILIGCPVSSRAWVLPYYLEHIKNLDFNKKQIVLCFLANNIKDNSLLILKQFQQENKELYIDIIVEIHNSSKEFQDARSNKIRNDFTYDWLSHLRNILLKKCTELDCTHFLSVDSDIMVKPDLLKRLLEHNLPIVSSLIYNGYIYAGFDNAYKYTNILEETRTREYIHISNARTKNPEKNKYGYLQKCDFTGACVLMTKEVCEKTSYGKSHYGEDEPWSWSARQAGFKLYCDCSVYSQHIMKEEWLNLFKDF